MKTCSKCKLKKPLDDFHNSKHHSDGKYSRCKNCRKTEPSRRSNYKRKKEWYLENKEREVLRKKSVRNRYKKELVAEHGGQCSLCSYRKSFKSLDFHHRDPGEKEFTIAWGLGHNYHYDRLQKEAAKCDLVCRNCHGEIHEELSVE